MNITLCGSIAFYDEMLDVAQKLQVLGHTVDLPPSEIPDEHGKMISVKEYYNQRKDEKDPTSWIWNAKEMAMRLHFSKVAWSDAIVVVNYTKHDIPHYIGANTLLEMGLAFYLHKQIYLVHDVPQMEYTEEILGMKPIVIHNDILQIQNVLQH
jgi:hypothetical protein